MNKNLYEAIGVRPDATTDQIEAACLALGAKSLSAHSAGDPAAGEHLKEIEQAFETLSDADRRSAYDVSLHSADGAGSYVSSATSKAHSYRTIIGGWIARYLNRFDGRAKTVLHGCLLLFIGISAILGMYFGEEWALRYRYFRYTDAIYNLDFDRSYNYLSPNTKDAATKEDWGGYWLKNSNMQVTERYRSAKIDGALGIGTIWSIIVVGGKDTNINAQKWVKLKGTWYRDYLFDKPESKVFSNASLRKQKRQAEFDEVIEKVRVAVYLYVPQFLDLYWAPQKVAACGEVAERLDSGAYRNVRKFIVRPNDKTAPLVFEDDDRYSSLANTYACNR